MSHQSNPSDTFDSDSRSEINTLLGVNVSRNQICGVGFFPQFNGSEREIA